MGAALWKLQSSIIIKSICVENGIKANGVWEDDLLALNRSFKADVHNSVLLSQNDHFNYLQWYFICYFHNIILTYVPFPVYVSSHVSRPFFLRKSENN